MKLSEIAERINFEARNYRIGMFQVLRKELKGLSRIPSSKIFTRHTIHDEWAFHHGGRKEIQFNIGFEQINNNQFFRHGVAFSLEPSQTLPNIEVLFPKIVRFNDYIREAGTEFLDFHMWYWDNGERSENFEIREIPSNYLKPGFFIFIGKLSNPTEVNIDMVLQDLDRLLNLYEYVEGKDKPIRTIPAEFDSGFQMQYGCSLKKSATTGNHPERSLNIILRHNDIQYDLFQCLQSRFKDSKVGAEVPAGRGKKIDIVVEDNGSFTFYEIKTSSCLQTCIRQALSQLIEYSFWPDTERATRLVIVTENYATDETMKYLAWLRERLGLSVYHQRFDTKLKVLEEPW
jgi:hypothetical protein